MKKRFNYLTVFITGLILALILGLLYSPSIPFKPNFPAITPLLARQQAFIVFMVPKIDYANTEILKNRTQILNIVQNWQETHLISYRDRSWLRDIANVYQVPNFDISDPNSVKELLSRVDIVPSSLVLAQSGNESGWGASRFALEADNFFGQHCNVPGCGVPPLNPGKGDTFEVRKFNSVQDSIDDYLYNLNTNSSYQGLRSMRAQMRANDEPIVGFRLVPYLVNYSILGDRYVLMISSIIVDHNLMQYDAIPGEPVLNQ